MSLRRDEVTKCHDAIGRGGGEELGKELMIAEAQRNICPAQQTCSRSA